MDDPTANPAAASRELADPLAAHAEALADLDRQIEHWGRMSRRYAAIKQTLKAREDRAVVLGLEGRKRILQRHAPKRFKIGRAPGMYFCAACGKPWESCPDWRDAAGQENPDHE